MFWFLFFLGGLGWLVGFIFFGGEGEHVFVCLFFLVCPNPYPIQPTVSCGRLSAGGRTGGIALDRVQQAHPT